MAVYVMNNIQLLLDRAPESRCAKCGKLTAPQVLKPDMKPGYEERLLKCSICGHAETVFIKL